MTAFTDIGIIPSFDTTLKSMGYKSPSPIQEQAIPAILAGKDIFGCAQTGTGKTGAFMIPTLQQLHTTTDDSNGRKKLPIRALILAPTRELAIQIGDATKEFAQRSNITHTVIFGGVSDKPQIKKIRGGVDVLIATPGRLLDLMNRKVINISQVEIFVLDEADRMLDMGFIYDIKKIATALPRQRQTLFFSATFAPKVMKLAHKFLNKPITIEIAPQNSTIDTVSQHVYTLNKEDKNTLLLQLLKRDHVHDAIVFTRTKHGANKIEKLLLKSGIKAAAIHGNKSQNARQKALKNLKDGKVQVLVATDVAARGIDVNKLSTVIIYDVPVEPESYVHRIGRTGRAGEDGQSYMFVSHEETSMLKAIHKLIDQDIPIDSDQPHHVDIDLDGNYPQFKQGGGRGGRNHKRRSSAGGSTRPRRQGSKKSNTNSRRR